MKAGFSKVVLAKRQSNSTLPGVSNPKADSSTTASQQATTTTTTTTTTTSLETSLTTTSQPAETTTSNAPSDTSTTTASRTTSVIPSSNTSDRATSTSAAASTSAAGSTVVTVITPTTVITVGTSTITSFLLPTTVTSTNSSSIGSGNSTSGTSSLSSGAKAGIIAGSVIVGLALLALLIVGCLIFQKKRRRSLDAKENIKWPEIAASADARAALYPEATHPTGRSGLGGDDMEETGGGWRGQPTLPNVPPSIYDESTYGGPQSYYTNNNSASTPYSPPQSSYADFSTASAQSHVPLAAAGAAGAGAGIEYHRTTPSPPRTYAPESSNGHFSSEGGTSGLPLPGSEMGHDEIEVPARSLSPRPMQVGDTFGPGYDEAGNGKGWRLSVVNAD